MAHRRKPVGVDVVGGSLARSRIRDRSADYDSCACGRSKRRVSMRCNECWRTRQKIEKLRENRYLSERRRREHRVVMEQVLGRDLLPSEVVHHINGLCWDNRPDNLVVFASHSEHAKFHWEQRRGGRPLQG
jgi:hypothetical protein